MSKFVKFQLQSQFQRFLYQTFCVISQIRDIADIKRDFILSPGSCPRGGTLGRWGAQGVICFLTWSCGISN